MPTCHPRAAVAAPATPPILAELIRVHAAFVRRKKREREPWTVEALSREADAVDRRATFKRRYNEWLVQTALAVDWNADPVKDLN